MFIVRILSANALVNVERLRNPLNVTAQRSLKRWVAPTLREMKRRKDKMPVQPPQHRSTFIDWNYQAELYAFGQRLNEEFRSDVLQSALTHRSYIVQEEERQREVGIEEPRLGIQDNQQLAAEGEQLMSEYLKQYLRHTLPRFPEEGICAVHDYLMTESLLALVSSHIGTKDLILSSDFPVSDATLAVTLKAIIGALAASSGVDRAQRLVRDVVLTQLAGVDVNDLWRVDDPLSTLAGILEREGRGPPEPRLIHEAGRNTILASYGVAIYSDKHYLGHGGGESPAIATEMAARDVLRRLFRTTDSMKPIPFDLTVTNDTQRNVALEQWNSQNVVQLS